MGSCLQMFAKKQQTPPLKPSPMRPADSDRRSLNKIIAEKEKQQSVCKSNIEIESNSSVRETKIFFKTKSTALFSTDSDRRHSSILQYTLDHESMIVKSTGEGTSVGIPQQYYTLVDKIAFVKKTMDCLKVTSPDGQSEINCQPQFLFSTLTISEGKPVDCIEQVAPNKFIQTQSSPIKLRLKLKCEGCRKKMKATFCKGVVHLNVMACPSCDARDNWSIHDISCNFPVWGGGSKIDNHQKMEKAPALLRVMGCVICLKFSNLQTMKCGCLVCKPCLSTQQNMALDQQCWMCQGSSVVY